MDQLRDMASEGPVIRLVNLVITRAIERRATDIHLEPFEDISGFAIGLTECSTMWSLLPNASRRRSSPAIKIMAKLNIAERRLPQDGRIMLRVKGKEIDFRVSTVPTHPRGIHRYAYSGQEQHCRLMSELGFSEETCWMTSKDLIQRPHGIILVTGPTGSGKTTTLYCALEKINSPELKIITVEDPVEYQLKGINQIQVKPAINLTFANALRSIVRQDPDVILIGEIRDAETAEIAIHSALTGHLVFDTCTPMMLPAPLRARWIWGWRITFSPPPSSASWPSGWCGLPVPLAGCPIRQIRRS